MFKNKFQMNSRLDDVENRVNNLEDRIAGKKNNQNRIQRNEDSSRGPWDNVKCTNSHITGAPGREETRELRTNLKKLHYIS